MNTRNPESSSLGVSCMKSRGLLFHLWEVNMNLMVIRLVHQVGT
jgi:hypothetical protein